jgi:membrane protease YdiL (CAAX protease family)
MPRRDQLPLVLYFALCFILTWGIAGLSIFAPDFAARVFGPPGVTNPSFFLAVYVPSVVGIALTAKFDGRPGLRALAARLDPRRGGWWVLITVLLFVAAGLVAAAIDSLVRSGPSPHFAWQLAPSLLATSLVVDPGPVGEELGWRGFALPRLLRRWTPLNASLILGALWALWHLPAFFAPGLPQNQFNLAAFLASTVALTVVFTWLSLKSRGNLLVAISAHLMTNHVSELTGAGLGAMQLTFGVAALLLVVTGQLSAEANPVPSPVKTLG